MRVMEGRSALFVRLPDRLVSQLDARIRADGRTKQAVVEDLLASQLAVDASVEVRDDEILDLAGAATLLGITESDVLERIAEGDFPARRFGEQWRCSRTAILTWLAGTDPITPRPTGFSA